MARFLWQTVALFGERRRRKPRVVDLAAGDGVLLDVGCQGGWVHAGQAVGLEIDETIVGTRGDQQPRIEPGDGLFDRPSGHGGEFDLAVGNPPFGRSRDILTQRQRQRLATDPTAPIAIWGDGVRGSEGTLSGPAGSRRVEQLFLQRALDFVGNSGLVVYIVPDTLLSNRREQEARDWLASRSRLLAALALPASAFRRPGLNANTHIVVLRKGKGRHRSALMLERRHAGRGQLPQVLDGMLNDLRQLQSQVTDVPGGVAVSTAELPGRRWDAGYWVGRSRPVCGWDPALRTADLGEFIELLTYGPIVTGSRARHVKDGVPSIRQGDFTETGLRRRDVLRIDRDSAHDPPRSRVQRGDLLMPRSGGGALGRNRVAVYDDDVTANIGCFVDLIRLRGLNPYYAWIFLRSSAGWGQIRSLINGVGTPNISFAEIRSLRVPVLPEAEQSEFEFRYRAEILPLHRRSEDSDVDRNKAESRFRGLVAQLEERLGLDSETARIQL